MENTENTTETTENTEGTIEDVRALAERASSQAEEFPGVDLRDAPPLRTGEEKHFLVRELEAAIDRLDRSDAGGVPSVAEKLATFARVLPYVNPPKNGRATLSPSEMWLVCALRLVWLRLSPMQFLLACARGLGLHEKESATASSSLRLAGIELAANLGVVRCGPHALVSLVEDPLPLSWSLFAGQLLFFGGHIVVVLEDVELTTTRGEPETCPVWIAGANTHTGFVDIDRLWLSARRVTEGPDTWSLCLAGTPIRLTTEAPDLHSGLAEPLPLDQALAAPAKVEAPEAPEAPAKRRRGGYTDNITLEPLPAAPLRTRAEILGDAQAAATRLNLKPEPEKAVEKTTKRVRKVQQ